MHEHSLIRRALEVVKDQCARDGIAPGSVREIRVTVGVTELHSLEAFEQAFEMQLKDTPWAGVRLALKVDHGRIECSCGHVGSVAVGEVDPHDHAHAVHCPKCHKLCLVQGGGGISSIELDVVEPDAQAGS